MEESKHPNSALELQCVRVRVRACVRACVPQWQFSISKLFPVLFMRKAYSVMLHIEPHPSCNIGSNVVKASDRFL